MNEQLAYARWLTWGVRLGLAALAASFVTYVFGLVPAQVPPAELPHYWGLSVTRYVAATGAPTGWHWLQHLDRSDVLNFVGVAILSGTTLACYLRMLPLFARRGTWLVAAICAAEIVVLAAAASGLLYSNH